MMEIVREVTVVADSSKLGRRSLSVIGRIESVQRVITDLGADEQSLSALRAAGLEVLTV